MPSILRWALAGLLLLMTGYGSRCLVQQDARRVAAPNHPEIVGVWHGHSVCEDRSSACHDEDNVYRFSEVAQKPDTFLVVASKVVDGKEVVMGSGEWKFDAATHIVESQTPAIRLTIAGDKMEGALTVANGRVYRRIYLKKES